MLSGSFDFISQGDDMSLMGSLKKLFGGSADESFPSSRMHVIDATRMGGNGGRERSPRDQVTVLQQIASFAQKEEISACVVLAGRPLREAADGEEYKGIRVFYADSNAQSNEVALKLAKRYSQALLITQDRDLENDARSAGIETIRGTTFRKALDGGGEGGSDRGGRGEGGNRNRRRSRGRRAGNGRPERKPEQNSQEKSPPAQDKGGVSDLIDLV